MRWSPAVIDRDTIHYVGTTRGVERRLLPADRVPAHAARRRRAAAQPVDAQPRVPPEAGPLDVAGDQADPPAARRGWSSTSVAMRSFPATAARWSARIPIVVVSYDRRPGLVSKLMARRAAACAVAFEGSTLPQAELTGAPVRQEMLAIDRQRDRASSALASSDLPDDRFVVAVIGGSLGAKRLNEVVAGAVRAARRRDVIWPCTTSSATAIWPTPRPVATAADGIMYRVLGYEDRMPLVYAAADLMMTRAGAATIAELATVGMPALHRAVAGCGREPSGRQRPRAQRSAAPRC